MQSWRNHSIEGYRFDYSQALHFIAAVHPRAIEEFQLTNKLKFPLINNFVYHCLPQELLHYTEQEDQREQRERGSYFRGSTSRSSRGSNRHQIHQQGGSLQDLFEAANNEQSMDSDFSLTSQSKQHQLGSRHKKINSSVSSRQREGGSLPSNVNVSTSYKEPFLYELNKSHSKQTHKNDRSSGGPNIGLGSRQNSIGSGCRDDTGGSVDAKKTHTVIKIDDDDEDETKHLLAHDSLAQVGYRKSQ